MTDNKDLEAAAVSYTEEIIDRVWVMAVPTLINLNFRAGHAWTLKHDKTVLAMRDALRRCVCRLDYISSQSCADHMKYAGTGWWESDQSINASKMALEVYEQAVREIEE